MKERLLFIGTALALVCYGCGGDDGGAATMPVDNQAAEQAADRAVDSTKTLTELKAQPDSTNALSAMSTMYGDLSAMSAAGQTNIPGFPALVGQKAPLETCVTATDTMVTYADCDYGGYNIDGTVSVAGDLFTVDLTMSGASAGTGFGFRMVGSITVTDTSIDGSLSYETSFSGVDIPGGGTGAITLDADYDNIGLNGMGCPISGSLTVSQSYAGVPGGYGVGDVRADFGPACGDVQLYN